MEGEGGFHRHGSHEKPPPTTAASTVSGLHLVQANNFPNINISSTLNPTDNDVINTTKPTKASHHLQPAAQCMVREQDRYMPIASVMRIMRRILPPHAKISDDAKETIQECVSEYISFITGEANDRCRREQRKTVTAEDVIWAMAKLGFDDYIQPLTLFLNRYRQMESERGCNVRDPVLKRSGGNVGFVDHGFSEMTQFMPTVFPLVPTPPPHGMFDPATMDGGAGGIGGSSSQNPFLQFDPFAQFR